MKKILQTTILTLLIWTGFIITVAFICRVAHAQERNNILVMDSWQRVEFSDTYLDPVVVIDQTNGSYTVGVRNVDTMGMEIMLKPCFGASLYDTVEFVVMERSEYKTLPPVIQQFAFGGCE